MTLTGRNDWYRLTRYLEIGLMQATDNAKQNPTSNSSSSSSLTSSTSVDCDKEHSLKRVREEEGERSFEKRETTSQGGGEVVGEIEEKGEKDVEHTSGSSLTGTCTPHHTTEFRTSQYSTSLQRYSSFLHNLNIPCYSSCFSFLQLSLFSF